ncbi:helix-turn-helix domain-containing protein [Stutzerimonas stutzeri]|uniref:helix-turn-helix domain-containing protein n=1 Tax=Stutzerimonas stutzeri TaxID=316 RepID=UPI0015E2E05F|nr:helix-turn-helix transcriptional regulator [Stutzerimonas stutzeri]
MRQELAATVGRIIARHRTALGITQDQLSLALDVDPITVSRFERGVTLPSLLTIQRLCEVFGVSLSQFFTEDAEPPTAAKLDDSTALLVMLGSLHEEERAFAIDTLKRFCRLAARRRK